MMRELALAARRQHIYDSVGRILGENTKMTDAVLRLTQLPDRKFLSHSHSQFPQNKPWCLHLLPFDYHWQLTTILLNKQSPRFSQPTSSRKTLLPISNGDASAASYKYPHTSKTLRNPLPYYIFLQARPCRNFVCARATHKEAISQEISPLNWSNLRICGGRRPPTQPSGKSRSSPGMPDGVLPENGFSSNKSASPTCKYYPSL